MMPEDRIYESLTALAQEIKELRVELRRDFVTRDMMDVRFEGIRERVTRLETERSDDKKSTDERFETLEQRQISRQDRLWIRLGQVGAFLALAISLFEFLAHVSFH